MDIPLAAIVPIVVIALGFIIFCLVDLARSEVRYLPKWAWAIICVASVPMGGIIYLLYGREQGMSR
jgi:nucleoside recognition membrane protein YjiH